MKITSIKEMIRPGVVIGDEKSGWASLVLKVGEKFIVFKTLRHYNLDLVKLGDVYKWNYSGRDDALNMYSLLSNEEIALEDLI